MIAVPLVSTASGALVMTVEKARIKIDGTFVPVLVVTGGATSTVHRGGEDGWTMSILFDPEKTLNWALARYGAEVDVDAGSFGEGAVNLISDGFDDG